MQSFSCLASKHFWMILLATLVITLISQVVFAVEPSGDLQTGPHQQNRQNPTTEEALAAANVPARDLAELAQRLKGVKQIPPPPASPVSTYEIGDVEQFWVHNDDKVYQIDATLIYKNDVVYMWVQNGYFLDVEALALAADRFAADIYPTARSVFGSEWSPGIDGDARLHILNSNDIGAGIAGYYYSASEYPQAAVPSSNEREIFFIHVNMINHGVDYYLSLLAHEFQHMIHWAVDANEESWLNEGLSELSAYLAGYGPSGFTHYFLGAPNTQLTHWPENFPEPVYGAGFLFAAYIYEQYGIDATRALVAHPENGMNSVQVLLDELGAVDPLTGEPMTTAALFAEWSVANYLNDSRLLDGRYGYHDSQLQQLGIIQANRRFRGLPAEPIADSVNQWGTRYYAIDFPNDVPYLDINFNGNSTVSLLPVSAHSGLYACWSNRVDSSDTRLTREFDLTDVSSATLSFWSWYEIEDGWDYAYIMVSPNGGQTWDILPTPYTTDRNPHGTAYGVGFTGTSPGWIQQIADLSPYTGHKILLRFEYITDDATLKHGFLLDELAIPEINYFTDFEQPDSTWVAEGWVCVDNRLNQQFGLHLIEKYADDSVNVRRLWLGSDAQEVQRRVNLDPGISEVVFVVSGFAPVTTQPATFDLHITGE